MSAQLPTGQIPFDLSPQPNFSLSRFEVGDSNTAAVMAVTSWPGWTSPILLLIGPTGAGKTHLGRGWIQRQGGTVFDVDNDAVATEGVVFIDDANQVDETQLFTVMNLALNGQMSGLLLASRRPPQDWDIKIRDLRSRLINTPVAMLEDHDDDILEPIIRKLFEDLGRDVGVDVVQYLIKHEDRSVDALKPVIAGLDLAAREAKRDLTRAFASQYLKTAKSLRQIPLI